MATQAPTLKAFLINQLDAAAELKIDCMAKNSGLKWNYRIEVLLTNLSCRIDTLSRKSLDLVIILHA